MTNKNYHRTYIISSNFIIFIKKKKKKTPQSKNFFDEHISFFYLRTYFSIIYTWMG